MDIITNFTIIVDINSFIARTHYYLIYNYKTTYIPSYTNCSCHYILLISMLHDEHVK